jgi:hypothetical protein
VSFVEWTFLFGGLAVAGPVIAHLLARPKFRRLPFTMLRFLRTGQVESRSRRKLRDLLILLLRCAIIALVAMLFARPLLHVSPDQEQQGSVFFLGLDNSMSMAYSDTDGSYFDKMIDETVKYIRSAQAGPGARVFDIYAMASGQWSRDLSREQALAEVKAVKIEPDSARVSDFLSGLSRPNLSQHSNGKISIALFSDFTPQILKQLAAVEYPVAVAEIDHKVIGSKRPLDNAAIIDARTIGFADGKLTISVTVANFGQIQQDRRLTASTGSNGTTPVEIRLPPGRRGTYQVQIEIPGAGREQLCLPVELSLSGTDGLKEDDTFYLGISVPGQKNTNVLIAGESINQLFLLKTAMDILSRMNPYNTLKIRQVLFGELVRSDLDRADVLVCSTITDRMNSFASDLQSFVKSGGRSVTFVTETVTPGAVEQLWRRDILAAKPEKSVLKRTYLQPTPCGSRASDVDNTAAKSLANYRVDRILMKGYLECTPHAESGCLWQFQDGTGFIYSKKYGDGHSIFVNTSIDDSLGTLIKSNASVAFCRYLLGRNRQTSEYCFERNERVLFALPEAVASSVGNKNVYVKTCDGRKRPAAVADSFLLISDPAGIGWIRTLSKPTTYAGINLPQGETDMAKPAYDELAAGIDRVFHGNTEKDISEAGLNDNSRRKPLWKIVAWLIILLLLVEPVVANRLKR